MQNKHVHSMIGGTFSHNHVHHLKSSTSLWEKGYNRLHQYSICQLTNKNRK